MTRTVFQVDLDGVVHVAVGLLAEDMYGNKKPMVVFTAFACDEIAKGRVTRKRYVTTDSTVTCLQCVAGRLR